MKALVFGASGQDGRYLADLCKSRGIQAIGCARTKGPWLQADVAKFDDVERLVREHRPELIFHLAANSTTRHLALFENHDTISTGTLNLLEAAHRHARAARIFLAGSGVQFANRGLPITESDDFAGSSPYAVARIQSVYAARYYRTLGLRTYVGYLFHHESPLRQPSHVSKLVALAAQRIARGSDETIELGDIGVEKEWTFAGDTVEGMMTLVLQDRVHEAVIGSGVTHTIRDWLQACFELIGKDWRPYVRLKEGFVPEYRRLVSNPATMFAIGWRPRVDLPQLAAMMMRTDAFAS